MESGWVDEYVTLKKDTGPAIDMITGRGFNKQVDSRVQRMLEIHETQTYATSWRQRRIKTKLFAWFLRVTILEKAKRALDLTSPLATAAAGATAAITLSDVALTVTILAGLMSILWYAVRLFDRFKYGRGGE